MAPDLVEVPVKGGPLTVAIWNAGVSPEVAVIAIHGLTMSHRIWSAVAPQCGDVTFIAPDLRGRGGSSGLPGPYGLARHAEDVQAVIDAFQPRRTVLVGHAMGGYVCERLASGSTVAEVVLVDGGLTPAAPVGVDIDGYIDRFLGPALRRLGRTYASREDYRAYWRRHPAFAETNTWNAAIESFVDYDLDGLVSRTVEQAVREDFLDGRFDAATREIAFGLTDLPITLLWAEGGLLNQRPGLINQALLDEYRTHLPQIRETFLPAVNHYTITLAEPGVSAVVHALRTACRNVTQPGR
ncbi:alpha/beta hydrolase [Kutzneria sp. CA-103260]|uniref:alpha/beta hydrolase n=1 Tax=Kutzneria sp. CA-103260 TaxID=2802641 RepID=UPI001BAD849F|nr:alpha/beta fold hydrolase [Kutzneria sp. CA-103260]QUQ68799.1 2-succinyl-6-hydroxy-2,4-cyclohexadiene-1-carboxylate synthase [Kutzneria sp. CA-103260]